MSRPPALHVDTAELRRHTGARRPFQACARLEDASVGEACVVDGQVDVDVVVEAVTEGVVAVGELRGRWRAPCRRCLEPVERDFSVDFHEVYEAHPSEGETWLLAADGIDLEPAVREATLLSLPLVALCREECAGPEPGRFPTTGGDAGRSGDPRWAALDELSFDE